jgi:hypothetical protein
MSRAGSNYIALEDVVNDWSDQSGELPLLTLRRICDWAICGVFPERTFLLSNGQQIDHLHLHQAMRRGIGMEAPITQDEAGDLLRGTIVSKEGIQKFCEVCRVEPPPEMRPLRSRLLQFWAKPEHRGPPDCPNGAEVAARLDAKERAQEAVAIFMGLMIQIRQRPNLILSQQDIEAVDKQGDDAQRCLESVDDTQLQQWLASLTDEWRRFTRVDENASEAAHQPPGLNKPPSSLKKRGAGRPAGSGSFEKEDLELVEEIRVDILSGKLSSIAAGARARSSRALGGGTEASKEKRLCTRYSERYPD